MTDEAVLKAEVWKSLGPHVIEIRDGLLDARGGLMRSMAIADEHKLYSLHRELGFRVMTLEDMLEQVDELLAFVSPSLVAQ